MNLSNTTPNKNRHKARDILKKQNKIVKTRFSKAGKKTKKGTTA